MLVAACLATATFAETDASPGGASTVDRLVTDEAFSRPSANLGDPEAFDRGQALFQKLWIAAPSPIAGSDGLGPLFNARSCQDCHQRDGRSPAPDAAGGVPVGLLLRLGRPHPAAIAAHLADPGYGHQLQPLAAPGQREEGQAIVEWSALAVQLSDGTIITLRAPAYRILDPAYGPLAPDIDLSPRIAPQMTGLGLLEAIPAADILAREDPDDRDGDGISGRANWIGGRLGRFGWKAGQPGLREQSAQAFFFDMGLSNALYPDPWGDCTALQDLCRTAPDGGTPEVEDATLDLVTYYSSNLGVPARPDADDPEILRGKVLFHDLNCSGCHWPSHQTGSATAYPEHAGQLIWPYTDLLLHDMGPALGDGLHEGLASGTEWRTPPLWGLGLLQTVAPDTGFLHDGRARTILEAILWHGGEAEVPRNAVVALPPEDRAALVAFLNSL